MTPLSKHVSLRQEPQAKNCKAGNDLTLQARVLVSALTAVAEKILACKGLHWLTTRFGGTKLRGISFDEKFRRGDWDFGSESPDLVHLVETYSARGNVLLLGCGAAPIARLLNSNSYKALVGVDISREAINRAAGQGVERAHFEVGDMVTYECRQQYHVILFSESLYYVPWFSRKRLLRRLSRDLAPEARIIVTISDPRRYAGILRMVRRNFMIDKDASLPGSKRHVLVFS